MSLGLEDRPYLNVVPKTRCLIHVALSLAQTSAGETCARVLLQNSDSFALGQVPYLNHDKLELETGLAKN